MAGEHYNQFIREAFLDPIRSVLIIDDNFPTLEEFLENPSESTKPGIGHKKDWRKNSEWIARMIDRFRKQSPSLLVDIHDGFNVPANAENTPVSRLHQCDLLVLDYHLDDQGDPTLALEILRDVMSNSHFNLVIVYTVEKLDNVFNEIRWNLILPTDVMSEQEETTASELIASYEDENAGFTSRLHETILDEHYFHSRQNHQTYLQTMIENEQPYKQFMELTRDTEWKPDEIKLVLMHLLKQREKGKNFDQDGQRRFDDLSWSEHDIKWITSKSAFIAFSEKTDDDNLIEKVHAALVDSEPDPSRLFLNRLRADIDEYGVAAQDTVLRRRHALAHWYKRLLETEDEEMRRWLVAESIERHSDRLMTVIRPRLMDYAVRLINDERRAGDPVSICKDHFHVDLNNPDDKEQAALEHNAFVCSKLPEGWHLNTGHIFSIRNDLWLCLSPSCDMVPLHIPSWHREQFGEYLSFVAVRLHRVCNRSFPKRVNSNRYIFLQIGDGTKVYSFSSQDNSVPEFQTFYAKTRGKFSNGFKFGVYRMEKSNDSLTPKFYDAEVVWQLRYEYALNFVQKLGVSLTRIGLDFSDNR